VADGCDGDALGDLDRYVGAEDSDPNREKYEGDAVGVFDHASPNNGCMEDAEVARCKPGSPAYTRACKRLESLRLAALFAFQRVNLLRLLPRSRCEAWHHRGSWHDPRVRAAGARAVR
jgi:hypothetical protein